MENWQNLLDDWRGLSNVKIRKPVGIQRLTAVASDLTGFPSDLTALYSVCNGLYRGWFSVLPVEDPTNISETWDGLERANDPSKTKFLDRDPVLLKKFIVFAEVGPGQCAVFDRTDASIWYEEDDELIQTDLSLAPFIDTCMREMEDA